MPYRVARVERSPLPTVSVQSRRSLGDRAIEQLHLAVSTPLIVFWLARALFVGAFAAFAWTGVGFMESVNGPLPGVRIVLVVLSIGWFLLPALGVLQAARQRCADRVELTVSDEGAKLAFPAMSAAAATEHVAARRLGGRLVVTVAGQTCALRDVNAAVVRRLLEGEQLSPEIPVDRVAFAEPMGALVSIESAPRAWFAIRGWLALKTRLVGPSARSPRWGDRRLAAS